MPPQRLPDFLLVRWDPQREDETFFVQSANLRAAYYFIQIAIHRPFIPSSRKGGSLSFVALAICASAARAFSHVADAIRKRYPLRTSPSIIVRGIFLSRSSSPHFLFNLHADACVCFGRRAPFELVGREEIRYDAGPS